MISNGADLHVMFPALPHAPHCLGWEGGLDRFCDVKCVRNDSSDTFLKWEDRLFIQEYCMGGKEFDLNFETPGTDGECSQRGLLRALQRSETHHIHILLTTKGSLLD